jgi:hypothetical protein
MMLVNSTSLVVQNRIRQSYLWKILTEDVILIRIDSSLARQSVPSDYEIYIDSSAKAHLLLVNQNNFECRFNGRNLGTADEVLHWIRIIKPQDYRYIPGTELTFKTISWYAGFIGSSNIRSRKAWGSAGNAVYPINKVSLNRVGKIKRGEVKLAGKKKYQWRYKLKVPRTRFVGINHDLYYKAPTGNDMIHQIKAAVEVEGWGSEAVLKVIGDEETGSLPVGNYNVSVNTFTKVWATITLGKELR